MLISSGRALIEGIAVQRKREQMWWLAACVIGLLVAAWAAGGFIGPLMAVFIVLFLAGAVLVEVDGRDPVESDDHDQAGAQPVDVEADSAA